MAVTTMCLAVVLEPAFTGVRRGDRRWITVAWFWDRYRPDLETRASAYASPAASAGTGP